MPKSKSMCSGCRNDFYNHNCEGECWSFKNAKIVTRMQVGTWQPPPYIWFGIKCLTCYHAEGYSMIERSDCRVVKNDKEAEKWKERSSK